MSHRYKLQLQKTESFALSLDETHAYYYQIQTQLFVCNVDYADFCVCTFATDAQDKYSDTGIHIERINKNSEFWTGCIDKAHHFFKTCVLPELLGSWYTRPAVKRTNGEDVVECVTDSDLPFVDTSNPPEPSYCYCRGPEEGIMIACDNSDCSI